MDIRKIALYLAGKLPPTYQPPNPGRFIRKSREIFPDFVGEPQMNFVQSQVRQSEDLYFMILDDVYRDNREGDQYGRFLDLLRELEVPNEVLGLAVSLAYTWEDYKMKLTNRYGANPTTNDKGELFEELCRDILLKDGFGNVKIGSSGADGGIDITADKKILIGANTEKLISFVGQCKYKSSGAVTKDEVNDLLTPIINDTNNMYQGVLFFTNQKYQPNAKQSLENTQTSRMNLKSLYLDGDEMLDIINSHPDLVEKYS